MDNSQNSKKKVFEKLKQLEVSDGEYAIIAIDISKGDFVIGANKMKIEDVSLALNFAIQKLGLKENTSVEIPNYFG